MAGGVSLSKSTVTNPLCGVQPHKSTPGCLPGVLIFCFDFFSPLKYNHIIMKLNDITPFCRNVYMQKIYKLYIGLTYI